MTITAKYAGTCPACRQPIAPGQKVEWAKGSQARHVTCVSAADGGATRVFVRDMPRGGALRGRRTGCRCGSIEGYPRSSDCRQCQYDNE